MRITQKMMFQQVTSNLSLNVSRLMKLQSQLSSSRRINKPSDDPMGVSRDLSYRSQLSDIEQFQSNISWGKSWGGMVEQTLGTIADFTHQAKEIATALANDTYDEASRRSAAREIESIFERMLSAGNAKVEDRYIFSGYKTRTEAFRASSTGVVYQGDQGAINIEIAAGSLLQVNQTGSEVMMTPLLTLGGDFDLGPGVTRTQLLADLNGGAGVDFTASQQIDITDNNTGVTVTVDFSTLPPAPTVGDVIDTINAAMAAAGPPAFNLTASVSPVGDAIRLTPAASGTITLQTPLENLNNGAGVNLKPGTFRITDNVGIDFEVDLSDLTTVGDVVTAFNNQVAANLGAGVLTMAINAGGTGLTITDSTGPPPLGLWIEDIAAQGTAQDLGLIGPVGSQLDGGDLTPQPAFTVAENGGGRIAADLGLRGSFTREFDGMDIDPLLTLNTAIDDLNNNLGLNLGQVRIAQGDEFEIVDLSTATTINDVIDALNSTGLSIIASLNDDLTGIQVEPTILDRTLIITDHDDSGTATALGIHGSPDVFGNVMLLIDALDSNDREVVGRLIGALGMAGSRLLEQRASVGAKIVRMETTENRLTELSLSVTRLLSEVEDADILALVTEMASQENMYQAALNAAARMITPSLIDFLR